MRRALDPRSSIELERPIVELEQELADLRALGIGDLASELERLERRLAETERGLFAELTPWQKVQLSRHPQRPYTLDYIDLLIEDFVELHGDRRFGDDAAIVGGIGRFVGR